MPISEVRLYARPRFHLGLLSLHEDAPRINGGIGFAVEGPLTEIRACEAPQLAVFDVRPQPMAPDELHQLSKLLERFVMEHGLKRKGRILISGDMRTHVGMGSATAIRLGALEALSVLNQANISIDRLVAASGRGGTSGIGVNTYFTGGLACDLGRPQDRKEFAPSSQLQPTRPPLILPITEMPSWPMILCVPRSITPKTQKEEIEFFRRITPLPASASFEASYIALFQIYAAAVERNYRAFCQGIDRMQYTAWKSAERAEYGTPLRQLTEKLLEAGADCVGMSSLGPMLFCFAEPSRLAPLAQLAGALDCDVYQTSPTNVGRSVTLADA